MQILNISIPNFPPLKNLELTFEPSLRPQVFPIGGHNGCGKSYLLNLIFALFNDKLHYWVKWAFEKTTKQGDLIAKITILDQGSPVEFIFYMGNKTIVFNQDLAPVRNNLYFINHDEPINSNHLRGENHRTFEWLNVDFINSTVSPVLNYSKGQLKHLALKHFLKDKKDSIILVDEIENSFDPDLQYSVVNDLSALNNQYLLATHSFYMCENLTPAHVKVLEPIEKIFS